MDLEISFMKVSERFDWCNR